MALTKNKFAFGSVRYVSPKSKCSSRPEENRLIFRYLQAIHQTGAVIRSGEYRPERPISGSLAVGPVLSPTRTTLENNKKIRPPPDRENAFARASGGVEVCNRILSQRPIKSLNH